MSKLKWYWFIPLVGILFINQVNKYSLDRFDKPNTVHGLWSLLQISCLLVFLLIIGYKIS